MMLLSLFRWLGFMDEQHEVRPRVWNFAFYALALLSLLIVLAMTGVLDSALR